MSIELSPSLLDVDGRLLEAYERITQAPQSKIDELNLNSSEDILATVGVAQISEYVILQGENIPSGQSRTWSLARLNQAVVIKSLFIDAPQADRLDFELLIGENKIFDFFINRSKTPYKFPDAPLPPNVSIRIKALTQINFMRIALQPAVILETLIPDEELTPER